MAGIRIVPAQASDVPIILEMIKALAEYEQLTHEVVATEDDLRQSLFGPRPAGEVVLAYAGDTPIGFALFFHNFSTFLGRHGLYLEDLFVVPEWRGKGVGKQLLAHIAAIAESRKCGRMEWAVLDWNESAIAFYRRMGAHVLDDWRLCRLTGHELRAASTRA
ncbi:MAG TPA: GNAT family N-acetyltransferase [Vicinamibacterales bacterium]|jgi:GNAT superfamily N-acetyltransferase